MIGSVGLFGIVILRKSNICEVSTWEVADFVKVLYLAENNV